MNCGPHLQTTLAGANPPSDTSCGHHPISCKSNITLEPDGSMTCEHLRVPADDLRTQGCLDHSIAILLIEILHERETHVPPRRNR